MKKQIITQAAFERTFQNQTFKVVDKQNPNVIKEIVLDGDYYEMEADGINGGLYLVYCKVNDLETPSLIIDIHEQTDVTKEVEIVYKETISSHYTEKTIGNTPIPVHPRRF